MKYFLLLLFGTLSTLSAAAQTKQNPALKRELDSIFVLDQRYREMIMQSFSPAGAKSVAAQLGMTPRQASEFLSRKTSKIDSSNMLRIGQIMRQHGYPGKTLVGTPSNEAAFYVIQHTPLVIKQYLPQVKQAADKGELPFHLYAMMLDRQLMFDGKEQVYGTQGKGYAVKNPTTGELEQRIFIWPIKDAAGVNERRKKAGFELTVEENAKRLNTTYRALTLAEAQAILSR